MAMQVDRDHYQALTSGVGFAELRDWTQIEVAGADRLKFLNNFCTADLRQLQPGQGTEAFICNVKGKVLGHVYIYCGDAVLFIETVPAQAAVLLPHLDRYTLSDDVTLRDVSGERSQFVMQPALSTAYLARLPRENAPWTIGPHYLLGPTTCAVRLSQAESPALTAKLLELGAVACGAEAVDVCRIEAGVPLYGRDITGDNLPQEVNRNAQAISFTKGCYLGQETVARIDALGHVNRLLVGVQFFGEQVPTPGDELSVDGKPVGHVTSAAFSPRLGKLLALAFVRAAHAEPGSRLSSPVGDAEVISLPLP